MMMRLFPARSRPAHNDWETLYGQYYSSIYNYFRFRACDDPEDLTAAVFERAWQHRHRYDRHLGEFRAWLFGIARNVAAEYFRQRKQVVGLEEAQDILVLLEQPLEQLVQQQAEGDRLKGLLQELPEREQDLIAMKYGMELTNREIARQTGLSESNVGTILFRVVRKLRAEWEKSE
ncbi:MAG: sigma-70 family RNA polymerase sigma factor [Chloroflexi bacterium]|jgi:RNA polymerase sigma-70 factor (ECF subfamily)|nr:sigma-70 family RNA polymerase sigma factor [Chloroflexota bacterium]